MQMDKEIGDKLLMINKQRERLKETIDKIEQKQKGQINQKMSNSDQVMQNMLQRKKKLQKEKAEVNRLKRLEDQYNQRRKQQERQKKLQKLQNEKRIIQLELAIKKNVFEGVKQKAKAMNSDQLFKRIQYRGDFGNKQINSSMANNLRKGFQQYMLLNEEKSITAKYDAFQLNEQRLKIFEAKEESIMRQILIKQFQAKGYDENQDQIEVMQLTRCQLIEHIEKLGIDIEDYLHTTSKQQILQNLQNLRAKTEERIKIKKKKIEEEKESSQNYERERKRLQIQLGAHFSENIKFIKKIVFEVIQKGISDYQKRITGKSVEQNKELYAQLQNQLLDLQINNEEQGFVQMIVTGLIETVHEQMIREVAEEVWELNQLTHKKAQQSVLWMINPMNSKLINGRNNPIELNFGQEGHFDGLNEVSKNKYLNNMNAFEKGKQNIFNVDLLTIELINDVEILQVQQNYFNEVLISFSNEKPIKDTPFRICYDRELFIITNKEIIRSNKIKVKNLKISDKAVIQSIRKLNQNWLIGDSEKITLHTEWCSEELTHRMGDRIGNKSGKITFSQFFPVTTIFGSPCSVILGFEKGVILKYNFNTDRITKEQNNITYYEPMISGVKTGNQPPFPLEYQNTIEVKNKKFQQRDNLHEFRQFFDYHTSKIVGVCFYSYNSFITVDQSLKCAIWVYETRQGIKSYEATYSFELVCSFNYYKQAQNPRYRSIFPNDEIKKTEEQMYKEWMQSQSFLKSQIYNNPKKQTAFFLSPEESQQSEGEKAIWKVTYDEKAKRINKIYEAYYEICDGSMEGKSSKIWKQYLFVLCERDHAIRNDLKSVKIYGWNIEERTMRSIAIQFDMFRNQNIVDFVVLDNFLVNVDTQMLGVLSSGRILLFSLLSGQLLRNLSDGRYHEIPQLAKYFFTSITNGPSYFAATTATSVVEITLHDRNSNQNQKNLNKAIRNTMKKFVNLI